MKVLAMKHLFFSYRLAMVALALTLGWTAWAVAQNDDEDAVEQHAPMHKGEVRKLIIGDETITYEVVDGQAIFEGDIILGSAEELSRLASGFIQHGVVARNPCIIRARSDDCRWPNGVVPFEIDDDLDPTMRGRIQEAINHWEQKTSINLRPATAKDIDRVVFRRGDGCSSEGPGRKGGNQDIKLSDCSTGNIIHEIGHAVGLFHEHTRCDRDKFVTIHEENIELGKEGQFKKHCSDASDVGLYDFGSIMHYRSTAFSKNGKATIESIPPGKSFGQRDGLSNGDIATVKTYYKD